jgi:hypothetical protein
MTVLILASARAGIWAKTDWPFVNDRMVTLFDKVAAFFHSTF